MLEKSHTAKISYSWLNFCSLPYPFGCLRHSRSHCLPLLSSTLAYSSHVSFSSSGCLFQVTPHECHQVAHQTKSAESFVCSATVECAHGRQAMEKELISSVVECCFFVVFVLFCHFVLFWDRGSRIRGWPLLSTYLVTLGGPWISNSPASTSLLIRLYVCASTPDFILLCWGDQSRSLLYARQTL